jgi:methylmalonyl-CoA mutase, N-terminal domain
MTINATAAILLALYVALGDEQGVPRGACPGPSRTTSSRSTSPGAPTSTPWSRASASSPTPSPSAPTEVPRWNTISISGYHIREAGATAAQEIAFTFANALEYVDRAVAAGLDVDDFAPRLSFFFAAHNDLFEEVAKFRAARRLWARLMRERYQADEASARLRFHTQTGGVTLTAQQPLNNVVRVTVQALSAVLGGTQSLHTNAYDEALALPTPESAKLALRTQQILAHESGHRGQTVDPLGGSYYVEALTDALEAAAREYLEQVDEQGGAARSIPFFQEEIHRAAYEHQMAVESGERVIVGVNEYREEEAGYASSSRTTRRSRGQRSASGAPGGAGWSGRRGALAAVRSAARGADNLLPPMVEAVGHGHAGRDQRRAARGVGRVPWHVIHSLSGDQTRTDAYVRVPVPRGARVREVPADERATRGRVPRVRQGGRRSGCCPVARDCCSRATASTSPTTGATATRRRPRRTRRPAPRRRSGGKGSSGTTGKAQAVETRVVVRRGGKDPA